MNDKEKIKSLLVDMVAIRNYCSCCIGKMNPTAFKKYDKIAERAEELLKEMKRGCQNGR